MGAYEVYCFWNGADILMALNAVAAIMGGGDYLGLMKGIAIVGLLSAVTYAFMSQRGDTLGGFFAGFVFVYAVLFVPKVDVVVNDVRVGTSNAVANVPLGLAAPYSLLSHMGYWLTLQYESRFTTLDDERFSKTGMVFGSRVLETMALRTFADPGIKSDVSKFYSDCVVPELLDNPTNAKTIRESKDIKETIKNMMNPGRGTVFGTVAFPTTGGSLAMACNQFIPALDNYITATGADAKELTEMARQARADEAASMTAAALAALAETDTDNMLSNMLGMSDTAIQSLTQSQWINGIHDANTSLINGYGDSATTSYTTAVTEQAGRQSAYAGKMWAEKALPLVRNLAEFILIAMFPLVFVIMLIAGEKSLLALKMYLSVLASLALWAPLTSILNYMVISNGKLALKSAIAASNGFTLVNMNGVVDLALSQQAMAGQLFLAVPIIAYAIVSAGAAASTAAIGSITGGAQSAAGSVGGQMAQGNASAGQVGWMNTNALNKSTGQNNTAFSSKSGMAQFENAAGTVTMGSGAPSGGYFSGRKSDMPEGASASIASGFEKGYGQRISAGMAAQTSSITSAMNSIRDGMSKGFRSENASQAVAKLSEALGTNDQTKRDRLVSEGMGYASRASEDAKAQNMVTQAQSAEAKAGLSAAPGGKGGGKGGPVGGASLGGGLSIQTTQQQSTGAAIDNNANTVTDGKNSTSAGSGTEARQGVATEASNSNSAAKFAQQQFEKAAQFGQQYSNQSAATRQASEELSAVRSDRGGVQQDLATGVIAAAGGGAQVRQDYMADPSGTMTKLNNIAQGMIASKDLAPGASTQLKDGSPASPVSGSSFKSQKDAIENEVGGSVNRAPSSSTASPEQIKSEYTPPAGGSGNGSRKPKSTSKPDGNGVPVPAAPAMPTQVQSASGGSPVKAADVTAKSTLNASDNTKAVSDDQAQILKKVASRTSQAQDKTK